jgi:hypothetical protein
VVLGRDEATAPNRSRLKRKAGGWLMALGRIAALNPELLAEITERVRAMYANQIGADLPWSLIAAGLAGLEVGEDIASVELRTLRNSQAAAPDRASGEDAADKD